MVMADISGKRPVDKFCMAKRSGLVMRDTPSFSGRSTHPCNRVGCSSRVNIMKIGQGGGTSCPQKAKSVMSPVCLSGGKEVAGSSKNVPPVSAVRSPKKETRKKKIALPLSTDSSETSSTRDELELHEIVPPPGKLQKGVDDSPINKETEVGSSSARPSSISRSRIISNSKNAEGSSKAKSVREKSLNPNTGQSGLRNLRCNSTGDMSPSNSGPQQNRSLSKRKDACKGRTSAGETSSSRGRKIDGVFPSSRSGVSILESRRTRTNGTTPEVHRSIPSVRVRRSPGSHMERNARSSSTNDSRFTFSRLPHCDMPYETNASSSSSSSCELSSGNIFRRFAINNQSANSRGLSPGEGSSSPESLGIGSRASVNWESFQQYTMEGIQEVLSALERIERDDLNYEQLISLETNLFLSSLNVYDQHRDMRMDIDNMSYEELLALGERMGSVSIALTEEAIQKCLEGDLYSSQKHKRNDCTAASIENDDAKCSICQEEYSDEDEVGRLRCEHMYHVDCISQWLRLKNWCPICKGPAEPSPSSLRP